jgi:hypothetical protein
VIGRQSPRRRKPCRTRRASRIGCPRRVRAARTHRAHAVARVRAWPARHTRGRAAVGRGVRAGRRAVARRTGRAASAPRGSSVGAVAAGLAHGVVPAAHQTNLILVAVSWIVPYIKWSIPPLTAQKGRFTPRALKTSVFVASRRVLSVKRVAAPRYKRAHAQLSTKHGGLGVCPAPAACHCSPLTNVWIEYLNAPFVFRWARSKTCVVD